MNELILRTTEKDGKEKIHSLFLWNDKNRSFSKIVESNSIEELDYNLYLVRKDREYPKLYTLIQGRLESKILQTANVSYQHRVVHYQKGKDWFGLDGLEEVLLGERLYVNTSSACGFCRERPIFLNHKENKILLFWNEKIVTIPNPCNEYFTIRRNFTIFVKNEIGLFDCYSSGELVIKPVVEWEYDDKKSLYLWDKDRLAWRQFSGFVLAANNALSKNHVENKKLYMELYKLNEKLELTFVTEGFSKYFANGILVGKTFFPYIPNTQNLDFEHPKTGFVQKIKNLFH